MDKAPKEVMRALRLGGFFLSICALALSGTILVLMVQAGYENVITPTSLALGMALLGVCGLQQATGRRLVTRNPLFVVTLLLLVASAMSALLR
jgi:uncharacterized membrane protein